MKMGVEFVLCFLIPVICLMILIAEDEDGIS